MNNDTASSTIPGRTARKRTRKVKEAEAKGAREPVAPLETSAHAAITDTVQPKTPRRARKVGPTAATAEAPHESTPPDKVSPPDGDVAPAMGVAPAEAQVAPRPRRVDPEDARAIASQIDLGRGTPAREATVVFQARMPGDVAPGAKELFWRRVGPALDRGIPDSLMKPLVLSFEDVYLATGSPDEAVNRFASLANHAYVLRRYGHTEPARKNEAGNTLARELVVEFLAGHSGTFLIGTLEHVRRVAPDVGWRLREVVVCHLLGLYREARANVSPNDAEAVRRIDATLAAEVDRLGAAYRVLSGALDKSRAGGLYPMMVNAWLEADPAVLAAWLEGAVAKARAAAQAMAAALVHAHVVAAS